MNVLELKVSGFPKRTRHRASHVRADTELRNTIAVQAVMGMLA